MIGYQDRERERIRLRFFSKIEYMQQPVIDRIEKRYILPKLTNNQEEDSKAISLVSVLTKKKMRV